MKACTPFILVKMTQLYVASSRIASSTGSQLSGGRISNVGHSMGSAPCSANKLDSAGACSRGRVTNTPFPNNGRVSHQLRRSRNRTTSPTTMTVGGLRAALLTLSTISAKVPTIVCCRAYVPHRMAATGVVEGFPS